MDQFWKSANLKGRDFQAERCYWPQHRILLLPCMTDERPEECTLMSKIVEPEVASFGEEEV